MKRNLILSLRYDGSAFHGWQFQPNCITVEEEMKKACKRILGEDVRLQSCSRTDAGVHANMFCCSFKTESQRDCEKLITGLNAVLPETISVFSCKEVSEDFHARYSCVGKEYIYKIWNGKQRNPFLTKYALNYPHEIDCEMLDLQARQFIGTFDFASFCASGSSVLSTVRTIYDCRVWREGETVVFSIKGNGFLYNMVRIIVGTLLDINRGKIEKDKISEIIASKNREAAGVTVGPEGLYLNKVYYSEEEILNG
ncbi:MAG: tRNA pseudouridine(38-40) synthase TruA [Clostridia bacterium]|nr:tRNA pseudouridine(38-40) synthase TruA [Clostridia bacterium]